MQPTGGFAWVQAAPGAALVCRPLEAVVQHLYTTRQWALGSPLADPGQAWDQVARAAGVESRHLARVRQVHGSAVLRAEAGTASSLAQLKADIIVTGDPSVAIAIQTADCVPLLIADSRNGVVAAAHAGWRGLAARVPSVAVAALRREFESDPADLVAAAGPSISSERYEVGSDVRHRFVEAGFDGGQIDRWFRDGNRPAHWQFDGWAATRDQLIDAGMQPDRIHMARLCTAANPDHFCSYRRDGAPAGRMAAVIRPRGGMIT